ncbi:MAG: ABC-F type ribosomal protection protein [Lachnospiraceae bacterium]|nr:ABC-F type ribosomal protection protein [Lachnospiraceae bacterium]
MILSCHNITKSYDGEQILSAVSFRVEEAEKVAVVGVNGAGKTTLLKIITGEVEADEGEALLARDKRFGYLAQNQDFSSAQSVYEVFKEAKREIIALEEEIRRTEELLRDASEDEITEISTRYDEMLRRFQSEGGYSWKGAIIGVARGLGFTEEDFEKKVVSLSGGERTRVALGKLLLRQPDIILLDEPTNHLDIKSVQWLETYLRNYKGAVVIVSHDRYFLDRIVTKVVEIERTRSYVYQGNYSAYSEKKARDRAAQWRAFVNRQREIRHQEEVIKKLKSFNREKSVKRAESREKMLDRMERIEKPHQEQKEMGIVLTPNVESGTDVLQVEDLKKTYGQRTLFSGVSFTVRRGEKVAIVGDNGTGKTTLLKIINKLVLPDEGRIRLGVRVHIGYYDQEMQLLSDHKTLFEEISDAYPHLDQTKIRSTLAAFSFTGEDAFKKVGALSGGERGKLALAKLMLSEANFLLLDEPTNHLDIVSREVLESAIAGYEGTVLYVSHDRFFINRTATRVMDLTNEILINYIGNYDYYIEHRPARMHFVLHTPYKEKTALQDDPGEDEALLKERTRALLHPPKAAEAGEEVSDGLKDWKAQKELASMKRKQASSLKKTEEMIASLEARNEEINRQFSLSEIAMNAVKLKWLTDEQQQIAKQLDLLYQQWEELS